MAVSDIRNREARNLTKRSIRALIPLSALTMGIAIVEEIEDKYDGEKSPTQWIRKISKTEYLVSVRIEIDTLNEQLGTQLPKGKYATLAGYIIERMGEIPYPGTVIKAKKVTFTVKECTHKAVQEVRITW